MMMMTKPPVNLLYLALSHSGVNDVAITSSVPQSMIDKAVDQLRTRLRACANWRLKAIILNICYRSLLNSVVIQSAFFQSHSQISEEDNILCCNSFEQLRRDRQIRYRSVRSDVGGVRIFSTSLRTE